MFWGSKILAMEINSTKSLKFIWYHIPTLTLEQTKLSNHHWICWLFVQINQVIIYLINMFYFCKTSVLCTALMLLSIYYSINLHNVMYPIKTCRCLVFCCFLFAILFSKFFTSTSLLFDCWWAITSRRSYCRSSTNSCTING